MPDIIEQCLKIKAKNRKLRKQIKELKDELKHCSKSYQELGVIWDEECADHEETKRAFRALQNE
jgi:cell division septum initiation protein DivIVA